jgi:transcriptional regulator with XRE-family HTH domain
MFSICLKIKKGENMIYKKIKELAQKKKISISELERRAGLSNGSISKWNNVSPNINNLKAVADVLKVKVDKLLE